MYVDDVLDSFETIEEACSLRRDLSEVLSDAGFKLRKWLSNESSVIPDVPIEDRVSGVEIAEGKDLPTQKTLGVTWNKDEEREQRKSKFTLATEETNSSTNVNDRLLPEKFSSFSRLLRNTAWVKRILKNCQLPNEQRKKNNVLQRAEISDTETFWIRRTQAEAFPNGEKENCLTRFCPQRDEDGLLRISEWTSSFCG